MFHNPTFTFRLAVVIGLIGIFFSSAHAADTPRALCGSIADNSQGWLTNMPELAANEGKILLSWRMLPSDTPETAFDIYILQEGKQVKINTTPISTTTNFQVSNKYINRTADNTFILCYAGETEAIDTYTLAAEQYAEKRPYTSILLQETASDSRINDVPEYIINDGTVADVDGDGIYEILVARCAYGYKEGTIPRSPVILEAYRIDGTFLWRVVWGNNIPASNSIAMIAADLDGDGWDEVTIRSSEGTIFGNGVAIGDTNGDGKTDYAKPDTYNSQAPEFISVLEGFSGKELARAPYIPIGTSEEWGDNYYKRANSLRLAAARLLPDNAFQIIACRGIYAKMELEAWEFIPGEKELSHIWKFSTDDYPDYLGQGNHQLAVADVDRDGRDEITYGASAIDHDGTGLYSTGLGHGDMLHVGKFIQDRDGLQCFQCFETGTTRCALRDAATGEILWVLVGESENDEGRCLIADIDPQNMGYEAWCADRVIYDTNGNITDGSAAPQVNFPIWWTGSLNRQLFDRATIDMYSRTISQTRVFNMGRYNVACANSSKSNVCFMGDILGDWREEIIIARMHPTATENNRALPGSTELMIFSTWHPTKYRFPYLMSDPVYFNGAKHQHVGYNTPLHLGYYLGSDMVFSGVDTPVDHTSKLHVSICAGRAIFTEIPTSVRLLALDGKTLFAIEKPAEKIIHLPENLKGIYLLHYNINGESYTNKIVL